MPFSHPFSEISPHELATWIEEEKPFFLLHTLTEDHYKKVRIPTSVRGSVYEMTFLDQVKAVTADFQTAIVIYGATAETMDAVMAARKLANAGYRNLNIVTGGLKAWMDLGFPVKGDAPGIVEEPNTHLELADETYRVDPEASGLMWVGRSPTARHHGHVKIASGVVRVRDGLVTGDVEIDMNGITNANLEDTELNQVLVSHLKSDDFFFTNRFPRARFTIEKGTPIETRHLSSPNLQIQGKLEVKGVGLPFTFPATVTPTDDGGLAAEAHFDMNRTLWDVIYGSTHFFEHLGMHLVFDMVSFEIRIVANIQS